MPPIPREAAPDSTLALLREGYLFISNRCQRHQTDLFQSRVLLQKTICMRGEAAARLFYDTERFQRKDAMPDRIKQTLFGYGGVQGLDDAAHRHRKAMLMSLMAPAHIAELVELMQQQWHVAIERWQQQKEVVLFDELREILCAAVCMWSGVPLAADEVRQRAQQIGARIDGTGAVGPAYWRARLARQQTEAWLQQIVQRVRAHELDAPVGSALHTVSWHRTLDNQLLDPNVATVELFNILRPTIAVGRFITFAALALHEHAPYRARLENGEADYTQWFVQEVRRFYPFFPFTAARVRREFTWQGYAFPKGTTVLLDLYGTNHDARLWTAPETFQPTRFAGGEPGEFSLIPQVGGDYDQNHRCAGEWITLELMKAALQMLVHTMEYEVPPQDLTVDLGQIPALPKSRFVISEVRRR